MRTVSLPNDMLIPEIGKLIAEGHSVTLRVKGVSMRPFLENCRDKAMLSPADNEILPGDVVLAKVDEGFYVLHRVIKVDGTRLTLKGDGNVIGVEHCKRSDVLAVAVGFYRKGRTIPDMTDGTKWKLYSRVWLFLTPIRRYLLAFHRRIWLKIFPVKHWDTEATN